MAKQQTDFFVVPENLTSELQKEFDEVKLIYYEALDRHKQSQSNLDSAIKQLAHVLFKIRKYHNASGLN